MQFFKWLELIIMMYNQDMIISNYVNLYILKKKKKHFLFIFKHEI